MKKHQHYVSPTDKKLALAAAFFPKSYRKEVSEPKYSKSLNNIAKNSKTPIFGMKKSAPRSMSSIEEENWKISFCGIRSVQISDDEFDETFLQSQAIKNSKKLRKSYSCQSTMVDNKEPDNNLTSPPIPVPLRGSRKRKSNFRNSGGYFFDKYMKRLREKCSLSIHRCQSVDIVDDSIDLDHEEKISTITNMKNNREDLAGIDVDHRIASIDRPQDLPLYFTNFDCDDLYPLRFGSSQCWDTEKLDNISSELAIDSTSFDLQKEKFYEAPVFWGDAISGDEEGLFDQNLSNTSSIINNLAASCRYSDTNSETLKAMETLYLCNFKVSTNGDWLCLKEVLDDATLGDSFFANSLEGEKANHQILFTLNKTFVFKFSLHLCFS